MKPQGELRYSDFKDIDWELFEEILWDDFISEYAVSTSWIEQNREFVTEITIESFRLFKMGGTLTIRDCAKLIENFLVLMFKFKPGQENIPDIDNYKFF